MEIFDLFVTVCGKDQAKRWMTQWRVFFMAYAGLFRLADGNEWNVLHFEIPGRGVD